MNARQLFMPSIGEPAEDIHPSGIFFCGKCRRTWNSEQDANKCCLCSYCGEEMTRGEICSHWKCIKKDRARVYDEMLAKAEAVDPEKYEGFVFCDHGGPNDGYAEDLETMAEWWNEAIHNGEFAPEDYPEFVQACNPSPPQIVTVGDLIERICEDGFEDMDDQVTIPPGLEKALQEFNEANKGLVSWYPDSKRKVKMPPVDPLAEFQEELTGSEMDMAADLNNPQETPNP